MAIDGPPRCLTVWVRQAHRTNPPAPCCEELEHKALGPAGAHTAAALAAAVHSWAQQTAMGEIRARSIELACEMLQGALRGWQVRARSNTSELSSQMVEQSPAGRIDIVVRGRDDQSRDGQSRDGQSRVQHQIHREEVVAIRRVQGGIRAHQVRGLAGRQTQGAHQRASQVLHAAVAGYLARQRRLPRQQTPENIEELAWCGQGQHHQRHTEHAVDDHPEQYARVPENGAMEKRWVPLETLTGNAQGTHTPGRALAKSYHGTWRHEACQRARVAPQGGMAR